MQKAYKRFLSGATKKLHKHTLVRLAKAGFEVPQMVGPMDTLDNIEAPTLSLGAFTSIEVS
jgi:hypothetical protein